MPRQPATSSTLIGKDLQALARQALVQMSRAAANFRNLLKCNSPDPASTTKAEFHEQRFRVHNTETNEVFDLKATDTFTQTGDQIHIESDPFLQVINPTNCVVTNSHAIVPRRRWDRKIRRRHRSRPLSHCRQSRACNGVVQPNTFGLKASSNTRNKSAFSAGGANTKPVSVAQRLSRAWFTKPAKTECEVVYY